MNNKNSIRIGTTVKFIADQHKHGVSREQHGKELSGKVTNREGDYHHVKVPRNSLSLSNDVYRVHNSDIIKNPMEKALDLAKKLK
jgi:hypothetical protein